MRNDDSEQHQSAYIAMLDNEHNDIVVAISNGDEEGAREAMRRHLRGSQARYRALLREQREPVR
ncbi:FCD domain protein [compost metagenome]